MKKIANARVANVRVAQSGRQRGCDMHGELGPRIRNTPPLTAVGSWGEDQHGDMPDGRAAATLKRTRQHA